jgi:radical SAM protein with 4Fe4S-binding SPASM domain
VLGQGIDVSISFVLNQRNIAQVDQMMELVLGLGEEYGKTVNMICNRYIGSFLPGISPTELQLKSAIRKIEKLHQEGYPIRFGNCIPQCFEESSSRGCSAGMSFATVDPWGNMRPCNHTAWVAGNLLEQSIKEIWLGKVMQEWRSLIPSECISCSVFSKCHGGCRAQALIVGGGKDNLAQEPLSKIPKEEYRYWYKDLQPIKHFYIQEDGKNLLAINKNKAVVLPPHQIEMINTLDGVKSLLAIKDIFGEESVDLIGILQDVGMVSWNNT